MGTNILVPGADFSSSAVGFNAAVPEGLKGLWFFNRGVRKSRKNLALGGLDADIFGTPADQGTFIRFKGGANFFQTKVKDTVGLTQIAVIKSPDTMADLAHSPMFVTNYGSGSADGFLSSGISGAGIYANLSAANITMSGSRYTTSANTAVTSGGTSIAVDVTVWKMVASRVRADRAQRNNLTDGTTTAGNFTSQARVLAAGDFRIGSAYDGQWGGIADVAAVVMYDRFITDAELSAMAAQLKNVMAHIGIVA